MYQDPWGRLLLAVSMSVFCCHSAKMSIGVCQWASMSQEKRVDRSVSWACNRQDAF